MSYILAWLFRMCDDAMDINRMGSIEYYLGVSDWTSDVPSGFS